MSRPEIPAVDVRKVLAHHNIGKVAKGSVVVLGIRGYFRDSMGRKGENDRGIYDDAFIIAFHDRCVNFNGNTDPSGYKIGIATLIKGVWRFIAGKHKLDQPHPRGYAAFRQLGDFKVTRDGKGEDQGYFGINFHRGGEDTTSSLGCQTVPPDQWKEFRDSIYKEMGITADIVMANPGGVKGKVFTYVLTDRADVEKVLGRKL